MQLIVNIETPSPRLFFPHQLLQSNGPELLNNTHKY